eukprot:jgi/Psemu1/38087/gm1.38087_g
MSKEGEFTAQQKLPPKYKDDNHFKQDWFMGIYMQLMTNHCPEWANGKPTCAMNFVSMEFPIFARDIEDMEASAAGPDIQLAQSWESPRFGQDLISTIRCKDTIIRWMIRLGIVPRLTPMVVPLIALQLQQWTDFGLWKELGTQLNPTNLTTKVRWG